MRIQNLFYWTREKFESLSLESLAFWYVTIWRDDRVADLPKIDGVIAHKSEEDKRKLYSLLDKVYNSTVKERKVLSRMLEHYSNWLYDVQGNTRREED